VAHVASVAVPCAACGADDGGSSRLAFFDMAVPHFGESHTSTRALCSAWSLPSSVSSQRPQVYALRSYRADLA
jgi:hypothetical protein